MKNSLLAGALATALAGFAGSASAQAYGDTARVISSTPLYERVSAPRRDCRVEQVRGYEERRVVSEPEYRTERRDGIGPRAVIGAIIGGVIGHQFGNSSGGRDRGTAAGAVVGGLIGNQGDRDHDGYRTASRDVYVDRVPVTRDVERCDTVADAREMVVGYDVRYEYNGREFRTRMPYDPGAQIPVNVEVRPPSYPIAPNPRGTY